MSRTFPALVVSIGKNAAWIVVDGEREARVADLKRATGKRTMLAPGDRVDVRVLEDGRALVDRVHERSFTLQRRSMQGRTKTMAANVDAMAAVSSLANPPPRLLTLDQLLAFAELEGLQALVVFTKPDLAETRVVEELAGLYERLGYTVIVVNPKSGRNMDLLQSQLTERHALLCGVSGVGKSTIFRWLGGPATVGAVSRRGLGKQTTSAARLHRFERGFLIDSPGVAEFGLGQIRPDELVGGFREMREPATRCKFSDCTHLHEPECGVRALVGAGIAPSRYSSYRRILAAEAELDPAPPL